MVDASAAPSVRHILPTGGQSRGHCPYSYPVYDESDERTTLTAEQMLRDDKAQSMVERGFRFLKGPMFFADSVFLKLYVSGPPPL
ncbi:MAG: hypothetical protein VKJ64_01585 [Leptolyngbyaceae bacterium]|nr:hypothetical protein [Leptolyngbyaceae bacterium]